MKVLFVCSQNMCRSPYCEYMFRKLVSESPVLNGKIEVHSSAVMSPVKSIHENTAKALMNEGFSKEEVYAHKPGYILRKYDWNLFKEADVIIGMTKSHKALVPFFWKNKFKTLSEVAIGEYKPVSDPWLQKPEDYAKSMLEIKAYIEQYVENLEREMQV
ncbi:MAG: hypothetical protein PUD72_06770 [Oscillospiraceae bacterium]|nr:hypothetical protein [Oscillospiraceae bacterium]